MAIGQQVSKGTVDGVCVGQSATDKVGFFGLATPVAQPALSAFAAVSTAAVISSSTSATCFGYTSAQATAIITLANGLRAALVTLGLGAT